jgi:hypothetical protein
MAEYKLIGKKSVLGKKKLVYSKVGSRKLYVKSKGKMMNIVKYKKMKMKKSVKKPVKKVVRKSKSRKSKSKKGGGIARRKKKMTADQKSIKNAIEKKKNITAAKNRINKSHMWNAVDRNNVYASRSEKKRQHMM